MNAVQPHSHAPTHHKCCNLFRRAKVACAKLYMTS